MIIAAALVTKIEVLCRLCYLELYKVVKSHGYIFEKLYNVENTWAKPWMVPQVFDRKLAAIRCSIILLSYIITRRSNRFSILDVANDKSQNEFDQVFGPCTA